jgi:hypothetical protein
VTSVGSTAAPPRTSMPHSKLSVPVERVRIRPISRSLIERSSIRSEPARRQRLFQKPGAPSEAALCAPTGRILLDTCRIFG